MSRSFSGLMASLGLLLLGCLVLAQAPGQAPPVKKALPRASADEPDQPRDPTKPSRKLEEVLNPPVQTAPGKAAAGPVLPTVALKGRILVKDKAPAALLEVEKSLY